MGEKLYVLGYTLLVTAVFVGAVSSFNAAMAERKELNRKVARQRIILRLFGREDVNELSDKMVANHFKRDVVEEPLAIPDGTGDFTVYTLRTGGEDTYVFPIWGQGFWGPIRGYMNANLALDRIGGVMFPPAMHGETPGLGGRISEEWFREQFAGLTLPRGKTAITMTPPDTPNSNTEYDAITGATETSRSVEGVVNDSVKRFLKALKQKGEAGKE